jgi:hypothetical protein
MLRELFGVLDEDLELRIILRYAGVGRDVLDVADYLVFDRDVGLPGLPVLVGVHDVQVDAVEDLVHVLVDYLLPVLIPVADLIVARPVGVRASQPRRAGGVGSAVAVLVPTALPVPAVVFRLADAHVGEDGLGTAGARLEGGYLPGGEPAGVGAVAGVVP